MHIALDISPLTGKHSLQHRVRGTGFYTQNLKEFLLKCFSHDAFTFFSQGENLEENIDIIHIPYFEPFFFTLPFRKQHKTVVTVHDLTPLVFPQFFPSGLKGKIRWFIQKNVLKNMDGIIADSEQSKKDIIRFTGINEKKVHVVYLAAGEQYQRLKINDSRLKKIREKYHLPDKFVLYVGDITWNKNLPRLVQAMQMTDIPIVMVGKALVETNFDASNPWNQDRKIVQDLAKDDKNILRVGFVPDEDLVALYNLATVFVMPSLYEGFGLPILEAMGSGCPVVTSKEGSIKEVAQDAAHFIDPYDVESIAQGVKEVFLNTSLQKQLSEKGLKRAKEFSWEKTAINTHMVYQGILQK